MYRRNDQGHVCAVLNDWDLGIDAQGADMTHTGVEVTGTVPFMAIDLLTQKALDGKVAILYRHELESFIWVLVWRVCCYDNGTLVRAVPQNFHSWDVHNLVACGYMKRAFLEDHPKAMEPASQGWKGGYHLASNLLDYLADKLAERDTKKRALARQARYQGSTPLEEQEVDAPGRVWNEFWTSIAPLTDRVPCIAEFMPKDLREAGDDDNLKQST